MPDECPGALEDLKPIVPAAVDAYIQATDALVEQVDRALADHSGIMALIGGNPLELMYNNHRNHAVFMATVFRLNSFDLLARTIPWVYRVYRARGFSHDYFPIQLSAWRTALGTILDHEQAAQITPVYDWMTAHHEEMVSLSLSGEGLDFSPTRESSAMQEILLSLLLSGDSRGCLKLAQQSVQTVDHLKSFYLDVVCPALYRIGQLWERNEISVAEEHLATAIVGRISSCLYLRFATAEPLRGKALVTSCPNEFHEVGARMLADFLELEGWDVTYLGASSPLGDIIALLRKQRPFLVALSVATIFNLENARETIRAIRADHTISGIRIMVGGLAFSVAPDLWSDFGADGYAAEADQAARMADEWWENREL